MTAESPNSVLSPLSNDKQLFEVSPFLAELASGGTWRETHDRGAGYDRSSIFSMFKEFRRQIRKGADDPEAGLLLLRNFRTRILLEIARGDLGNQFTPPQIQSRLKRFGDMMLYGAWLLAENDLRRKYVHPIILERRNISSPVAVCSLSRLGSADPLYTTAPAPIFVHCRSAEFSPALKEKDFIQARRSDKEYIPAREYFLRLANRTISYLWASDAGANRLSPIGEDHLPNSPALLPGPLVILFSVFEEHFLEHQPLAHALSLLRLRFSVGHERLGRAVEAAARETLIRAVSAMGRRLKPALNAWFRDRARAEGLPLIPGSLLDIEKTVRLLQFRYALDDISLLDPSPVKALSLMAREGCLEPEQRKILSRAYNWQWFIANRLAFFGRRAELNPKTMRSASLDRMVGFSGASVKTVSLLESARALSRDLVRDLR